MKKLLLVFCCLIFTQFLGAQENSTSNPVLQDLHKKALKYYHDFNYTKSIETNATLIAKASKDKNYYYKFKGYSLLGNIYNWALKDSTKAFLNYRYALEQAKYTKQDSLLALAYISLGHGYNETGENHQKSIEFYQKSILLNNKSKANNEANLIAYISIGWAYVDLEQPEKAYPYIKKAIALTLQKDPETRRQLNLQTLLGRYFLSMKNYDKAIEVLQEVANISEESDQPVQAMESNHYLSQAYEMAENYKGATVALKKEQIYNQRIYNIQKIRAVEEAGAKLELTTYQEALEESRKQTSDSKILASKSKKISTNFIMISVIFLLTAIAFFLLYRSRKKYMDELNFKNKELVDAKNQAEEFSKAKAQFFSTVSHELRTPLYGVIGLSAILLENEGLKEHKEDLTSLKFSADYLLALINDVLIWNKTELNSIQLENTSFELSLLMNNIKKSFAFSLEQNNNSLQLFIDPQVPNQLFGDSIKISQILMNLVGNAVKFNENSTVEIRVVLLEKLPNSNYKIKFEVKDDGIGIPENMHHFIFEEYSQIESKNYSYQGTGLGLPIVKKLVGLFDSDIVLNSDTGKGSSFSFALNLQSLEEQTNNYPLKNNNEYNNLISKNIHILIVDDNKINQKITQKILESRNIECSVADDGVMAIEMVSNNDYNAVLMDIHMPVMGGIEATTKIREFNKTLPIIALTAVELEDFRDEIFNSGMNDIILKPYDISQFLNVVLKNLYPD